MCVHKCMLTSLVQREIVLKIVHKIVHFLVHNLSSFLPLPMQIFYSVVHRW